MALVNEHYLKLSDNYLFADIAKKVNAFKVSHPKVRVISLGIGDVTQPLCPAVIEAMHKAVDEMATKASFHGYGPERGYDFLREAIVKNDYLPRGIHLDPNEVFVNDGAKSDTGNIGEIVRWDNSIGVTDPIARWSTMQPFPNVATSSLHRSCPTAPYAQGCGNVEAA
jgi:LL-diaminopimelate aminotransferase